jgi:hypothetical protein
MLRALQTQPKARDQLSYLSVKSLKKFGSVCTDSVVLEIGYIRDVQRAERCPLEYPTIPKIMYSLLPPLWTQAANPVGNKNKNVKRSTY